MQTIITPTAPPAIGPYSQAIKTNNLIFCSGQIAINPETGQMIKSKKIGDQTRQVCQNLKYVIKAAGGSMAKVVKTTVYLKDFSDYDEMNRVYKEFFISKPARATVEVSRLPKGALVEIEAIAGI